MSGIGDSIESIIKKAKTKRRNNKKNIRAEYDQIVKDIMSHPEFRKLNDIRHHHSSILSHASDVSYLSFRIARALGLDHRSAARGGLLHDFFLYDWRNKNDPARPKGKIHGRNHPKVALGNSVRNFRVSRKEKDIIVKHMWPATLTPPVYKESLIVSLVDKYYASREYGERFGESMRNGKRATLRNVRKLRNTFQRKPKKSA
jgi:uncharacterized protein